MNLLISGCCRDLHTWVGFGQTPVRPLLIVEEGAPVRTEKNQLAVFVFICYT